MQTVSTKQFIEKARKVHGGFYNYDKVEYIHSKLKVIITCPIHGDFELTPNKHLLRRGCPKCGRIRSTDAHRDNKESFIKKAIEVHGNKYDYSKVNYINSQTKVTIICPIHGEFYQAPANHLSGLGCSKCGHESTAKLLTKSVEQFILEAKEIHGNKYDYSLIKYVNIKTPVYIICHHKDKYGNEHGGFLQTPKEHIQHGRGCPKCKLKNQTELYNKLKVNFPNEEILFEVNSKIIPWLENLRIDIYFSKYNIAVEYNGILHYIPVEHFGGEIKFEYTKALDKLKREKCLKNKCTLFEVPYNYSQEDFDKLTILINNIINNNKELI